MLPCRYYNTFKKIFSTWISDAFPSANLGIHLDCRTMKLTFVTEHYERSINYICVQSCGMCQIHARVDKPNRFIHETGQAAIIQRCFSPLAPFWELVRISHIFTINNCPSIHVGNHMSLHSLQSEMA